MILLLDDDPVQRLIAEQDLRGVTSDLLIPQRAMDLPRLHIEPVKLVIVDRWLGEAWKEQVTSIIHRVPNSVPIWEWTCDEWGESLFPRVSRILFKRPGVLVSAVAEWLESRR